MKKKKLERALKIIFKRLVPLLLFTISIPNLIIIDTTKKWHHNHKHTHFIKTISWIKESLKNKESSLNFFAKLPFLFVVYIMEIKKIKLFYQFFFSFWQCLYQYC